MIKPGNIYFIDKLWIRAITKIEDDKIYFDAINFDNDTIRVMFAVSLPYSKDEIEYKFSQYRKATFTKLSRFKKKILKLAFKFEKIIMKQL